MEGFWFIGSISHSAEDEDKYPPQFGKLGGQLGDVPLSLSSSSCSGSGDNDDDGVDGEGGGGRGGGGGGVDGGDTGNLCITG